MNSLRQSVPRIALIVFAFCSSSSTSRAAGTPQAASLRIRADVRSPHPISPFITGKFAEHLGNNIYNGMDAQILRNPTFAPYPFSTGQMNPDGVTTFHYERDRVDDQIRRRAIQFGFPESEAGSAVDGYHDGLACWWMRVGPRAAVQVSPDTGPRGGRAQRVETQDVGQGIAQWTWLPLHRVRRFEFELMVRSPDLKRLEVTLGRPSADPSPARILLDGLSPEWRTLRGSLELPADTPPDMPYPFAVTAEARGQFVIRHARLWPADHLQGADPDVVRLLCESRLPLLRWPGGNFVSGYHWEDGIGPIEQRPTLPNYAWGAVEPNLFGTDEFIAFCRAAGCEPMICVNAGDGTPEEAARWIEYCNGSTNSPMGRLRAANGHPEPFRVRHWEVGNELWGKWQFHWTTVSGYVDRFQRFAQAMLTADPGIRLYACGAPVLWGKAWNDTLIAGTSGSLQTTTDHPLVGGHVSVNADPLDVFRDFMAVPDILEEKWAALRDDMSRAGIRDPRLAVTELQLFARLGERTDPNAPARLNQSNLVHPGSLAEALYDVLIYHAVIRLAPFGEFVTQSATVNHGGGLRKERERVYPNPCHHAQAAFADLAGAHPVRIELEAPTEQAPLVLPDLKDIPRDRTFKTVDALAAVAENGDLLISIVHRRTDGPTRLRIEWSGFRPGPNAKLRTLSADVPWAANTLDQPRRVQPMDTELPLTGDQIVLELAPFTVARLQVPAA